MKKSGNLLQSLKELWGRKGDPGILIRERDIVSIRCKVPRKGYPVPACELCDACCCQGGSDGWGIHLHLFDIARLVDLGMGHMITGRYKGIERFLEFSDDSSDDEIDLPRLRRIRGRCPFLDTETLRCRSYATRPGICRAFPFEIVDIDGAAIFSIIDKIPCEIRWTRDFDGEFRKFIRLTLRDENLSSRSDYLLANYPHEVAAIGFQRFMPASFARRKRRD